MFEVPAKMIEAGVDEFLDHDIEDLHNTDPRVVVFMIFKAMMDAAGDSWPRPVNHIERQDHA